MSAPIVSLSPQPIPNVSALAGAGLFDQFGPGTGQGPLAAFEALVAAIFNQADPTVTTTPDTDAQPVATDDPSTPTEPDATAVTPGWPDAQWLAWLSAGGFQGLNTNPQPVAVPAPGDATPETTDPANVSGGGEVATPASQSVAWVPLPALSFADLGQVHAPTAPAQPAETGTALPDPVATFTDGLTNPVVDPDTQPTTPPVLEQTDPVIDTPAPPVPPADEASAPTASLSAMAARGEPMDAALIAVLTQAQSTTETAPPSSAAGALDPMAERPSSRSSRAEAGKRATVSNSDPRVSAGRVARSEFAPQNPLVIPAVETPDPANAAVVSATAEAAPREPREDPAGPPAAVGQPAAPHAASAVAAHAANPVRGAPETVANLAAQIIRKLEGRSTRFDVELNPADLGRVDVRIEIGAQGRVTAAMAFDNPQAAAELRGRAGELRQALEQAGFNVSGGLSFDVAGDKGQNGQAFAGQQQQQGHPGAQGRGRAFQAALETVGDADQTASVRAYFQRRSSTGVDVRI